MIKTLFLISAFFIFNGCTSSDTPSNTDKNITDEKDNLVEKEEIVTLKVKTLIKKTGEIKSYNEKGDEVTDDSLQDDGYYQKGLSIDYTRASDIVTDELNSLMWQDDNQVKDIKKQWLTDENYNTCSDDFSSTSCYDTTGDTAETYCSELTLGGYRDWRLPTSVELETIINYGKYNPVIDEEYFQNISVGFYWSSSTYKEYASNAWYIDFKYGDVYGVKKNYEAYVRCVR